MRATISWGADPSRDYLRIQRRFQFGSRVRLDGMFEVYNVFNHENFGAYTTAESNANYGLPQPNLNIVYQPRMLQWDSARRSEHAEEAEGAETISRRARRGAEGAEETTHAPSIDELADACAGRWRVRESSLCDLCPSAISA